MKNELVTVFDYFDSWLTDEARPPKPWLVQVDGRDWLAATNGRLLVGCVGSDGDVPPDRYKSAVIRYLSEPIECVVVSRAELEAFSGIARRREDTVCEECDGTGFSEADPVKCEHCGRFTQLMCEACDGAKTGWLTNDYAWIADIPINRPYLSYGLSIVPDCERVEVGSVTSENAKGAEHRALVVQGNGWRVVLMAVKADAAKGAPVFKMKEPQHAEA